MKVPLTSIKFVLFCNHTYMQFAIYLFQFIFLPFVCVLFNALLYFLIYFSVSRHVLISIFFFHFTFL